MYTKHADEYHSAVLNNVYNANFERPSFYKLLPPLSKKTVLDLGCGPGVYAQHLISQGAIVTAIDASQEMVEITKSKINSEHNCYRQDLSEGLPNENSESYDLVISPLTIHYIEHLDTLFNDVSRVLKKDGLFIFSTHHPILDFKSSKNGNYFSTELITETWKTVGQPVQVSFYRRPLSAFTNYLSSSGMVILNIAEGEVTKNLQQVCSESYEKLSRKPNFIFFVCKKA